MRTHVRACVVRPYGTMELLLSMSFHKLVRYSFAGILVKHKVILILVVGNLHKVLFTRT